MATRPFELEDLNLLFLDDLTSPSSAYEYGCQPYSTKRLKVLVAGC